MSDWDAMEEIWQYCFRKGNLVSEEEHMLLTVSPDTPKAHKEKVAQMFFERFCVPSLFLENQSVLALCAQGRTSGLVLDCGDGISHTTAVYEGHAMPHSVQGSVSGHDVTEYLGKLLRDRGHSFVSSAEREIVREMKEHLCFVSPDAPPDPQQVQYSLLFFGGKNLEKNSDVNEQHSNVFFGTRGETALFFQDALSDRVEKNFELPDGQVGSI